MARRMVTRLARELPGREINVTADSAYNGEELRENLIEARGDREN
jgi:hypothetical protein